MLIITFSGGQIIYHELKLLNEVRMFVVKHQSNERSVIIRSNQHKP